MSPAARKVKGKFNPIPCHNEMRTKIWGVKCETGLRYKQIGMKKYCITQAVLEPNPYMKDSGNFVSVMVVHDKGEHLMAVLRHGQIYQVNLNMPIDRDKNVAFYLVGRGTVYLLGYEVILPKKNREGKSSHLSLEVHSDHSQSEESDSSSFETTSQKHSKSLESGKKKKKSVQQAVTEYSVPDVEEDDSQSEESDSGSSQTTPQKHSKSLKSGKKKNKSVQQETPVTSAVQILDNDSSEEDPDFSEDENEFESEDSIESEVEVDKSEVEALIAETEDPEPIPASKKRKLLLELQLNLKRPKIDKRAKSSTPNKVIEIKDSDEEVSLKEDSSSKEEDNSKEDDPSMEDSTKELSESGAASSCNGTPQKDSEPENLDNSAEKKKKKKKKKKKAAQETVETPKKTNKVLLNKSASIKSPNLKKMTNGLEIQDLKVGHGPVASHGKMVHVFFVGRLPDKSIFESCVPGKKPLSFILGANNVLKGLEIGIEGMKTGGKRKITVPPSLGYGNKGAEGVPPNTALTFVVELQAVS